MLPVRWDVDILASVFKKRITEAFKDAHGEAEIVTKQDLREMELRQEVKLAEIKSDLIRWVVAAGFLQTALISALLLKLIK